MVEAVVFTYGLLASFVLSGMTRNKKLQRPNPRMLEYVGYVLCGSLAASSAILAVYALTGGDLLAA